MKLEPSSRSSLSVECDPTKSPNSRFLQLKHHLIFIRQIIRNIFFISQVSSGDEMSDCDGSLSETSESEPSGSSDNNWSESIPKKKKKFNPPTPASEKGKSLRSTTINYAERSPISFPSSSSEEEPNLVSKENERQTQLIKSTGRPNDLFYRTIRGGDSTSKSSQLSLQMSIHTHNCSSPATYKCDFCPEKFIIKKNRDHHVKRHQECKRFECPFCKNRFSHQSSCNIHWKGNKNGHVACKVRQHQIEKSKPT